MLILKSNIQFQIKMVSPSSRKQRSESQLGSLIDSKSMRQIQHSKDLSEAIKMQSLQYAFTHP
jgi:hypothetical protein